MSDKEGLGDPGTSTAWPEKDAITVSMSDDQLFRPVTYMYQRLKLAMMGLVDKVE